MLPASFCKLRWYSSLIVMPKQACSCFFAIFAKSLSIQNNGKTLYGTLPWGHDYNGKVTVLAHWDNHLLKAVLSSLSEQAMKRGKYMYHPFLFLELCGTVVMNGEASELQLRQPCLE